MRPFKSTLILIAFVTLLSSCNRSEPKLSLRELKEEVRLTEKAFADSVGKKGFYRSLIDVSAEEVVVFNDGDTILQGIDAIRERVKSIPTGGRPPYLLTWSPTRIDVSASGDLAYTYGWFENTAKGADGNDIVTHGLYCSIWKKFDGKWKLVVD